MTDVGEKTVITGVQASVGSVALGFGGIVSSAALTPRRVEFTRFGSRTLC